MIDFANEELLTLSQASKKVPGQSGGHVNVATVWRWAQRGLRGAKLETLAIGGTLFTSAQALQRFFGRGRPGNDSLVTLVATPAIRKKAIEAAVRELAADGI